MNGPRDTLILATAKAQRTRSPWLRAETQSGIISPRVKAAHHPTSRTLSRKGAWWGAGRGEFML